MATLAPSSPTDGLFAKAQGDAATLAAGAQQNADDTSAKVAKLESDRTAAHDMITAERDRVAQPASVPPTPPPAAPKPTDPVKQWGSAAMILGLFASALTRRPFDTALAAATGVLTAYQKGDQAAANTAFQHWQIANDYAIKMQEFQQNTYMKIMKEFDTREHAADQRVDSQERALMYPLRSQAIANGDQKLVTMIDTYGPKATLQYLEHNETLTERMKENSGKVAEQHAENDRVQEIVRSKPYLDALRRGQAGDPKGFAEASSMLAAASPKVSQQIDHQMLQASNQMIHQLQTLPIGKQYEVVQAANGTMDQARAELKKKGMLSAVTTTALLDQFQRGLTSTALRQFMVKMLEDHYPYPDRARMVANMFNKNGGGLDKNQAEIVLRGFKLLQNNVTAQYRDMVHSAADRFSEYGGDGSVIVKGALNEGDQSKPTGGPHYASPQDVGDAVKSGTLSVDEAKTVLCDQFGMY